MDKFPFRKDDGSIVWVDFDQMMQMDSCGYLDLGDGEIARRARDLESRPVVTPADVPCRAELVSDSAGFIKELLPYKQAELKRLGVKGVEFKEDPQVPGFIQTHFSSFHAQAEYVRKIKWKDKNSYNGSGSIIGEADIRNAQEMLLRD